MTAAISISERPDRTESVAYYHKYIDQVPDGDICATLRAQTDEVIALLDGLTEEKSLHRYAPDKWSIRQVVAHINDVERVFTFRAFWFARDLATPLPSFDQDAAVRVAGSDERSLRSHLDEFLAIRSATSSLFEHLSREAWTRRGIASDNPVTVRALAWIVAGHAAHHLRLLRERYL